MTILCWTPDDVNVMLDMWKADTGYTDDQINFVNFGVGGGEASAQYDQYFLGGSDVDIFMVEADWALKYINDDSATAPMSDLGFSDDAFAGQLAHPRIMAHIGRIQDGACFVENAYFYRRGSDVYPKISRHSVSLLLHYYNTIVRT
mgnify:CR=1 FL=1